MEYYVYILANGFGNVLYTGMTNNLYRRLEEHRTYADPDSFTAQYNVNKLVWFEATTDVRAAIEREKQIKGWNRARKVKLIAENNPRWEDLSASWSNKK